MSLASDPIFQWLAQYAYEPGMVYALVFCMMIASGFGLPIPEEVTIISVGLLAYMGSQPLHFPPPYPGATPINGIEAAIFTTLAVFFADTLVFLIGRVGGRRIIKVRPFSLFITEAVMEKVNNFISRFGMFATFIFRFTPGVRFPGHIILGMSDLKYWKFLTVDGFACILSIPTQILLIYHLGEPILMTMKKFKYALIAFLAVVALILIAQRIWLLKKQKA